jgi:hypothetical protein
LPGESVSTGKGKIPLAHSATRSAPPRSTPNDPFPHTAHSPGRPHTRHTGLPPSITIGPRHVAHAAGSPQDRHTLATPYPRRETIRAADRAAFSSAPSLVERSSPSGAVVSTRAADDRSREREGRAGRMVPRSTPTTVSMDGANEASTQAAPCSRARAMATSRTW